MARPVFRQLLVTQNGSLYRPLGFTVLSDSRSESYIKVVIPSLRTKLGIRTRHVKTSGEIEAEEPGTARMLDKGVTEFSYHYRAGVSHYKSQTERELQRRGLAHFPDQPVIHLLRLRIFDLEMFLPYPRFPQPEDIELKDQFDGTGRVLSMYLLRNANGVEVNEADPLLSINNLYSASDFVDPELTLLLVDSQYSVPTKSSGWDLFTYDDPTIPSRPPYTE